MELIKTHQAVKKRKTSIVDYGQLAKEIERVSGVKLTSNAARMRYHRGNIVAVECHSQLLRSALKRQARKKRGSRQNGILVSKVMEGFGKVIKEASIVNQGVKEII
jgi:hypothetical protein